MLVTASEIIEQSWGLYTKNFRRLGVFMFFMFIPTVILSALGILGIYLDSLLPNSAMLSNIVLLFLFFVSVIFTLWTGIALAHEIKQLLEGGGASWKQLYNTTTHLIWPSIYTSILVGLVVLGGSLLFIIPGVIFTVWYAFSNYAVIFDEKRGLSAMRASKGLVVGQWWGMLWRLFVPPLFFILVTLVVRSIFFVPFSYLFSSQVALSIFTSFVSSLVNALVTPLTMATIIILFQSAKKNPLPSIPMSTPAQPPRA